MCGLYHSSLVTDPVSVIGLFRSYCAAKEWCATTERTGANTASVRAKAAMLRVVIVEPPGKQCGPGGPYFSSLFDLANCSIERQGGGRFAPHQCPKRSDVLAFRLLHSDRYPHHPAAVEYRGRHVGLSG